MTSEKKRNKSAGPNQDPIISKCPTVLIQDDPTFTDSFGGHERVVTAIHDLLLESNSGFSIGLEGTWGSGKSTIVNMLLAKLTSQNNFRHVLFDAWAHHGDPLRRSFLETLIQVLVDGSENNKGWIDKAFAEEKLDILQNRKKETIRRIFPNLEKKGAWLALGTLIIPIGLSMLNSAFRDGIVLTGPDSLQPSWKAIIGIILSINPLIFIVIWAFEWMLKKLSRKTDKSLLEFLNVGMFLNQKDDITERSEVIETPDPTSIEFEKMFNTLLDQALNTENNRLLIIIDNIDRVDPEDSLSILSTLQTFMDNTGRRSKEWKKRLWILLPYSFKGIEKVIGPEAAAFIDKRFQIRFQVPPPVLTAYKQYLEDQLCVALPNHCKAQETGTSSEFHEVYLVFEHFLSKGYVESTPRAIKLFVNQIGAIHRQWNDTIPLSHIAIYVILCVKKIKIVERVRKDSLLNEKSLFNEEGLFQFSDEETLTKSLVSLAFNIEADSAMQIVLEPLIKSSLSSGDSNTTKEYMEKYPDAFWLVSEKITFSDWLGAPEKLLNCIEALSGLDIQKDEIFPAQNRVINEIIKTIKLINKWDFLEESQILNIVHVVDVIRPAHAAVFLFTIMNKVVEDLTKGDEYLQNGNLVSELIETVADALYPHYSEIELEHVELMVPGGIEFFLDVFSRIGSKENIKWINRTIKTEIGNNEAINQIKSIIKAGKFRFSTTRSIFTCRSAISEFPQLENEILDAVHARLQTGQPVDHLEISPLYFYLWDCLKNKINQDKASTVLREVSENGLTFHYLARTWGKPQDRINARLIFTHMYFFPDLKIKEAHANAPESNKGKNLVTETLFNSPEKHEQLITILITMGVNYGGFSRIHDLRKQVPASEAFVSLFIQISINKGYIDRVVPDDGIIEFFKFIKPGFGQDYMDILSRLISSEGVLRQVIDEPFNHEMAEIYEDIILLDNFENEEYRLWIPEKLRELNRNIWSNAFNTNTSILSLVITRYENAGSFILGSSFQDGLVDHAELLIRKEPEVPIDIKIWKKLFRVLNTNSRSVLRARLLNEAKDAEETIQPYFFQYFGEELLHKDIMTPDRSVIIELFNPIVQKRNSAGMEWLSKVFDSHPKWLKNRQTSPAIDDLRNRLAEMIAEDSNTETEPDPVITELFEKMKR